MNAPDKLLASASFIVLHLLTQKRDTNDAVGRENYFKTEIIVHFWPI